MNNYPTTIATGRRPLILLLAATLLWVLLIEILALKGVWSDFSQLPPRMLIVFVIPLLTTIYLLNSKTFTRVLQAVPVPLFFYLQSFRILVELLLWYSYRHQLVPVQITLEGSNYDLITGITAPVMGWLMQRYPRMVVLGVCWNLAGLALLANVVITAFLSLPTPFRHFMNEPSTAILVRFPFVILPGLLVPLAYTLHCFSLKQLIGNRQGRKNN